MAYTKKLLCENKRINTNGMANGAQPVVKISGCLEKKAKLRIVSPWKKYWFVLEGRLLLYYRSKDEYEAIRPCKGSINLCPPCNVKPALSAACVFQIEYRASTVTLRAENRHEQERWMQALLAAIAHSKSSPNRMSHFRYSLDDLPTPLQENKSPDIILSRQNTLPYRSSMSPKKEIIERLQNIGAQTYGGSLGAITKFANKEAKENKSNENDTRNFHDEASTKQRLQSVPTDNEQYDVIQEENSFEIYLEENTKETDNVIVENDQYVENVKQRNSNNSERTERNVSFLVENDQYCQSNTKSLNGSDENLARDQNRLTIDHLYDRISSDSNISDKNVRNSKENLRKQSGTPNLYERISTDSSNSDNQSKLTEQYSVVHKNKDLKKSLEDEYTVPINYKVENTDHNKNSLLIDNDNYITTIDDATNDNQYSDGLLYTPEYIEYDAIDKTKELEELYEDPDCIKKIRKRPSVTCQGVVELTLPPRRDSKKQESSEETSSQTSSTDDKRKQKKSRFRLLAQLVKSERKTQSADEVVPKSKPKSRSTSFIHRVWRRKAKSLDTEDEITYETVEYEFVEKQINKDKNDIEMLKELQQILETRKNMLQKKLNANEKKLDEAKARTAEVPVQPIVEEKEEVVEIHAVSTNEPRPMLPPRQNSQSLSPYHDVPQNNQIVDDLSKNNQSSSIGDRENKKVKTIDEILDDLNKEKDVQESKHKVKQLIDKFNVFQGEEEVVLRKKSKSDIAKTQSDVLRGPEEDVVNVNRNSDELIKLLEQLSKVTCAPVLAPGATSSLITPILTDDEWLQLIPIRRRRLSDPDYDVPRPHRSLQFLNRNKQTCENAIPATRFFGPILPSTTSEDNKLTTERRSYTSMDPDSLESFSNRLSEYQNPTAIPITTIVSNVEKQSNAVSYASHDYISNDKVIYALPKAVIVTTKPNKDCIYSNFEMNIQHKSKGSFDLDIKTIEMNKNFPQRLANSDETFIDSLEPLTEISTAF